MKNMPVLFRRIEPLLSKYTVSGIGVSVRPENTEESFMPVFNAGISFSETASALTGAQLFRTSHQENHLEAAAVSSGCVLPDDFIGVHFSGGTSEILDVHRTDNGYECDGPMFNIYHVSPHETQNPEEFVTEACCPVRKQ